MFRFHISAIYNVHYLILLLCALFVSSTLLNGNSSSGVVSCEDGQYQCGSSKCIPDTSLCDGVSDCEDGTDEIICESAYCGFDNGTMCGWSTLSATAAPGESFTWQTVQAKTFMNSQYSPKYDFSQGTPRGWYARAATTPGSFHASTTLVTGQIHRTAPQCQLRFIYFMNGPSVGSILVYIAVNGTVTPLWETTGGQGKLWQPASVFIGAKRNIVVGIRARRGQAFSGAIAIDQLLLMHCKPQTAQPACLPSQFVCSNGNCIDPQLQCNYADDCGDGSDENRCDMIYKGRCSFTNEICSFWTNAVNDQMDWTLAKGSTPTLGTGPSVDHTTRTTSGGYIYIDGSSARKTGDLARLTSLTINGTSKMCSIRLWYHMWGVDVGTLTVLKQTNYSHSGLVPLRAFMGNHGYAWMFTSTIMDNYRDSRDFKKIQLTIQQSSAVYVSVAVSVVEPDADSVSEPGAVSVPEPASDSVSEPGTASVVVPLAVYVDWNNDVTPCLMSMFYIVIQGSVGRGLHNNIAIDDISLSPGCKIGGAIPGQPTPPSTAPVPCGSEQLKCQNGNKCYSLKEQCDFIDSCGDNTDEATCGSSCDFESNSTCGWENSAWGNSSFELVAAGNSSGPTIDHTFNTMNAGHFIFVQNLDTTGDTAMLESSLYRMSTPLCQMTFWYNAFGSQGTIINVVLKMVQGSVSLFNITTNSSNIWQKAHFNVGPFQMFSFIIEVVFPRNAQGHVVAIDDVSFINCGPNEVTTCPPNMLMCASLDQCIPRNRRCDKRTDCTDGSDEDGCVQNPGDCNFDAFDWMSLCGWSQRKDDDADWTQLNYRLNPNTGADADHNGSLTGKFLTVNTANMLPGDVAGIQTQFFPNSTSVCYVRFYYYMYGSVNIGPLRLYIYNSNYEKKLMWSISGNKGQSWQYANVLVGDNANFSVIIETTAGTKATSDIAIDDVTFTPECNTGLPAAKITSPVCNAQTEFYCKPRNKCLSKSWQCDGVWDCPDGSDESTQCQTTTTTTTTSTTATTISTAASTVETQPTPSSTFPTKLLPQNCPFSQFECGNEQCIPSLLVCDGVKDCEEGADEMNCRRCRIGYYFCVRRRLCMTNKTLCDNFDDCGDGTDESLCSPVCSTSYCKNGGTCITGSPPVCACPIGYQGNRCQFFSPTTSIFPKQNTTVSAIASNVTTSNTVTTSGLLPSKISTRRRTTSTKHLTKTSPVTVSTKSPTSSTTVSTKSPTSSTTLSTKSKTSPTTLSSWSRTSQKKLHTSLRTFASNNSTMTPAQPFLCAHGQFWCGPSQCIPAILQCDGVPDCGNKRDEGNNCTQCPVGSYFCMPQRKCLLNTTRCDGSDDCGDGSDESLCRPACGDHNFSCQNGGTCVNGSSPPMCSCASGNQGNRCQYKSGSMQRPTQQKSTGNWKIGVGIVLGLVGLFVIAIGAFLIGKYRKRTERVENGGFSNRAFEEYGTGDAERP